MVFGERIQEDPKIQLLLKNIILHLDSQIETMKPSELCHGGQVLIDISALCLCFEEDVVDIIPESTRDLVEDHDENDDEEENVISSLFPSTNRRDMLQLCDTVLNHIIMHSKDTIKSFAPNQMKHLLKILDPDDSRYEIVFETLRKDIAKRKRHVKMHLSASAVQAKGGSDESGDNDADHMQIGTLRKLFKKGVVTRPDTSQKKETEIESTTMGETSEILRMALNKDALDDILLRNALEASYDFGWCAWRTSAFTQTEQGIQKCALSDMYP